MRGLGAVSAAQVLAILITSGVTAGCDDGPDRGVAAAAPNAGSSNDAGDPVGDGPPAVTSVSATSAVVVGPTAPSVVAPASCPADMVLVSGNSCPRVEQRCLEHTRDYEQQARRREAARARGEPFDERDAPERCLRYAEPTKCLSPARRAMRFCMDRYEWPNQKGALPPVLQTWSAAHAACVGVGKRLCTVDEFTFACEGENMWPYAYGYVRDDERCNIDRPYVQPDARKLAPWELCLERKSCRVHFEQLDQRVPAGSMERCDSPFGAFDVNGNVNEWVERPGQSPPWRSGLMGGWWGPARSRCRPLVTAHDENYVGYEVGFRCCRTAVPR